MTIAQLKLKVEVAFQQNPFGTSFTWTDISHFVEAATTNLGRNYETDHNEASTITLQVRNDGRFNPANAASPYAPWVLPFRPVRLTGLDLSSFPTAVWYGYIQSWPQDWSENRRGLVQLAGVDAFKAVFGFIPGDPYDVRIRKDYGVFSGSGAASTNWDLWAFDETSATGPFASENTNNTHPLSASAGSSGFAKAMSSPTRWALSFNGAGELTPATTSGGFGEFWMFPTALPTVEGTAEMVLAGTVPNSGGGTLNAVALAGLPSGPYLAAIGGSTNPTFTGTGYCGLVKPFTNIMPSDNAADMETSIADWAVVSGTPTISRVTGSAAVGNANLRVSFAAAGTGSVAMTTQFPVVQTQQYGVSFPIKMSDGTHITGTFAIRWYNSSHVLLSTSGGTGLTQSTSWAMQQFSSTSLVAPVGAAFADLLFTFTTTAGGTLPYTIDLDAMMVFVTIINVVAQTPICYRKPSAGNAVELVFASTVTNALLTGFDIYQVTGIAINTWYHVGYATRRGTGNANSVFCVNGVAQTPTVAFGGAVTAGAAIGATGLGGIFAASSASFIGGGFKGTLACVYFGNNDPNISPVTAAWCAAHYAYGTNTIGNPRQHDYPQETTSQRVTDICTAVGFPGAQISVETGLSTMRASGDVTGIASTQLLEDAADAELGNVFVNQAGQVVFHNRSHRNSASPIFTFGENAGEIGYEDDFTTSFDDQYIFNDVQITQDGANPSFMWEAQDNTSQNTYGLRVLQKSPQCVSSSDVTGMANTLLAWYKNPLMRVTTLSIEMRSKPALFSSVLSINIGDAVTVKRRPLDAPSFTFNAFVDGIAHDIDARQWKVTFMLTPYYPNTTY